MPEENIEEIEAEIDALLTDVESEYDVRTSWERTRMCESAAIDTDSPLATIFRRHSEAIADVSTEAWGINASTDVRNFVNDADIEAITWGPGDISQAHTYDEHLSFEAAATGLDVLLEAGRVIFADKLE